VIACIRPFIISVFAVLGLLMATNTLAQSGYPNRPIKFIAPFPPGGASDVITRIISAKLAEAFGQPVTVENRGGAAGNIGTEFASKQPADGYTLLLGNSATFATNPNLYKRMPFDTITDFAPVTLVATAGSILVVHPSVPANNVAELIAHLKANAGKLNFSSGGNGTPAHVIGESFKSLMGVSMTHVPYKGTALAVADLVAGQVQICFADMVPAVPQIRAGKIRALAVTSENRSAIFPDLPTLAESNVPVKVGQTWWSMMTPKGTPRPIIDRLNAEVAKIMRLPDVQERYASLGVFTAHTTPEGVIDRIKADTPEFGKVLKAAGVEPE
jgi:tripartite-type tricarboxylate transporter receptor subunit TctC